jgi:ariadne-1
MSKCLSATQLFNAITGEAQYEETFYEEPESLNLNDADLFDLMFNDSESDEDSDNASESPRNAFNFALISPPCCSENECSICFTEFDNYSAKLDCGHRFCAGCVSTYLRLQIDQAPRLHHKVSRVTRDDIALVVTVHNLVGVKCPHFSCLQIIEDKKIKAFVDDHTWDKFDRFALDQTLTHLQINGELTPCPLGCGYFIQDDCLCVNPDCRQKQLAARLMAEKRRLRLERLNAAKNDAWAQKNPELVKLCPKCFCQIEKNGGCDHMYCTRCKQNFLWSKALPFKSKLMNQYLTKHSRAMKKMN